MAPIDFSGRSTLSFRARGDARPLVVLVLGAEAGAAAPRSWAFSVSPEWQRFEVPLDEFGGDRVIAGLAFVAQLPHGTFAFAIDDLELH